MAATKAIEISADPESQLHLGWRLPPRTVRTVVESYGHFAHRGDPDRAVAAWEAAGFDGREVEEWLHAGCFSPRAARELSEAGVGSAGRLLGRR